jgi:hypothetical protein
MAMRHKLWNSLNMIVWNRAQLGLSVSVCNLLIDRVAFANKGLVISNVLTRMLDPEHK